MKRYIISLWYNHLQYCFPKRIRRFWCTHEGTCVADEAAQNSIDMATAVKIECVFCGKTRGVFLGELWKYGMPFLLEKK